MFALKRTVSTALTGLLVLALLPINAWAVSGTTVEIKSVTSSFSPANNEKATISWEVKGPDAAKDLQIRIFEAPISQPGAAKKCSASGTLTAKIEGPGTYQPKVYNTQWGGKKPDGTLEKAGVYCFILQWSNHPSGASYGYQEGLITVSSQSSGGGSGSAGSGSESQATLVHYVNPYSIDPSKNQVATIYYTVNKSITGLSLVIRDSNNEVTKQIFDNKNITTSVGSYSKNWNGKNDDNTNVSAGVYTYVFAVNGQQLTTGKIWVTYSTGGSTPPPQQPQQGQFITSHSAFPPIFNPSLGEKTTIYYTLGKSVTNFKLSIRDSIGNTIDTLESISNKSAGIYTTVWTGTKFNLFLFKSTPVSSGMYYYVIEASNENPVSGTVTVAASQQQDLIITDFGPNPSTFDPTKQTTTFAYQVNQDAQVTLTIFSGSLSVKKLLKPQNFENTGFANATNYVPWNGKDDNENPLSNGTYTYIIEAKTVGGKVAQPKTGSVSILTTQPPPPPAVMDVSNLSAYPNPFNPDIQSSTALKFILNYDAYITVTVTRHSDGAFIKTVTPLPNQTQQLFYTGANEVSWNGTDQNNVLVTADIYDFRVDAVSYNYGTDYATTSFTVNRNTSSYVMDVSNPYANPNPFNADIQNTLLTFSLNQNANVTITVTRYSDGAFIKTVTPNEFIYAGTNITRTWNGADQYGTLVTAGQYKFTVYASSTQYGSDSATSDIITVNRNSSIDVLQITDYGASPNPFNPQAGQISKIDFSVNMTPSSLTVRVYRNINNTYVRDLPVYTISTYSYRAEWNGKDNGNYYFVSNDLYYYKIDVTASSQTAQKTGYVTVSSSIITPPPTGDCGNFTDVPKTHYLCPAIEFVKSKGIFGGYPDGSLGINRVIQRAELLAVIQKAFKYPLESYDPSADGNLGYKDLKKKKNRWYMPYIKTFSNLGLMVGYPDGRMRPERTMNTAELYLVFLKAAKKASGNIAHFTLANSVKAPPFVDVPLTHKWYIKYAAFAQLNDLVVTSHFYPGKGITRGQVIKLIYDTHLKGLITY